MNRKVTREMVELAIAAAKADDSEEACRALGGAGWKRHCPKYGSPFPSHHAEEGAAGGLRWTS